MENTVKRKAGRPPFTPGQQKKPYATRLPPKLVAQLSGLPHWIKASQLIETALIQTYPLYFGPNAGKSEKGGL